MGSYGDSPFNGFTAHRHSATLAARDTTSQQEYKETAVFVLADCTGQRKSRAPMKLNELKGMEWRDAYR